MCSAPLAMDRRLVPAGAPLVGHGLVGGVSFTHGAMRLHRLSVRRTSGSDHTFSFPARTDHASAPRHNYLPFDRATQQAIEAGLLDDLHCRGELSLGSYSPMRRWETDPAVPRARGWRQPTRGALDQ